MKFFHLSDLHIGKHLFYYSLLEDQKYVFHQILEAAKEEQPDAVLLCGDIYDKTIPSAEAVSLFDWFLTELKETLPKALLLIIAGNHDSGERLEFARELLEKEGVFIAGLPPREADEKIRKVTMTDSAGEVCFYLLPFTKPSHLRKKYEEEKIDSYEDAVKKLLEEEEIDTTKRNVLLSHQFYLSGGSEPLTCDSEIRMAGGIDEIDTRLLEDFDYVALGHIHRAQRIGKGQCYYSGTPLKYSVSEASHEKSFQIVELGEKGQEPVVRKRQLKPLRELCVLRGTLQEVLEQREHAKDFVSITLTDEEEPYMPKEQLELVFDHILEIRIDNERTRRILDLYEEEEETESLFESFTSFFETVQGRSMNEAEQEAAQDAWNEIIEGGAE
ncbi:MAG: exonuclease SbcCD subunit D [Lachnospiraceae bacterium]|nr:exonuclease SbcCD subunit D [Lachnospiraceae bacterium]